MISRAIICYICYVALVVLALVFGHVRGGQAIRATLLVAPSPYANIFKIYTFLLPITLLLVQLRARTGLLGPWVVVAGIWLLDWIVLDHLPAPPVFAHFAGFLFGIGTSWGPSILHSLTLVVMGMTLGAAFFSPSRLTEKAEMHAARLWLGMATGLSLLLLGTKLGWFGLHGVLLRIADITQWRGDNDIGYYAYGLLSALGLLFLARSICIIAPQWVVTPRGNRRCDAGLFLHWECASPDSAIARLATLLGQGIVHGGFPCVLRRRHPDLGPAKEGIPGPTDAGSCRTADDRPIARTQKKPHPVQSLADALFDR